MKPQIGKAPCACGYMEAVLADAILLCDDVLHVLAEEISAPWTQAEIDAAEAKVPALKEVLGIE